MSAEGSNPLSVILEPAIVGSILVMSVYFNRNKNPQYARVPTGEKDFEDEPSKTRQRQLCGRTINTKNTAVHQNNRVSRFLNTYPFIIEVFYLLLTYWIYQLSRAMTALSFEESTRDLAIRNAERVLRVEKAMHIDFEYDIQQWFIKHHILLSALNRIYSFIHIPATCAFFGWLYYTESKENFSRVRRTMATCNWIAFFIFTFYPCAPPRFLPESYGFVDTIHKNQVASIWTTNRFCNQYAAMPSLHFGYSFLIGFSLFMYGKLFYKKINFFAFLYPIIILFAIVATANHFILDAVAGFFVSLLAFAGNRLLLNFLPLEDFVFYYLRIHKPPHRDDLETPAGKGEEMEEFLGHAKDLEV
jgi:hypothetical protein